VACGKLILCLKCKSQNRFTNQAVLGTIAMAPYRTPYTFPNEQHFKKWPKIGPMIMTIILFLILHFTMGM